jgi:hypothetical protein
MLGFQNDVHTRLKSENTDKVWILHTRTVVLQKRAILFWNPFTPLRAKSLVVQAPATEEHRLQSLHARKDFNTSQVYRDVSQIA